MQLTYKLTDKLTVSFEASGQKEILQNLSVLSEIFSHSHCGACRKPDIRYVVRETSKGTKKFQYYELHCQNPACRARLAFGQHSEGGTLFPKKKDDEGNYLPNNGWVKFNGKQEEGEQGAGDKPSF
jgi:hypothetical protein